MIYWQIDKPSWKKIREVIDINIELHELSKCPLRHEAGLVCPLGILPFMVEEDAETGKETEEFVMLQAVLAVLRVAGPEMLVNQEGLV